MKRSALALLAIPLATVALALGAAPAFAADDDEQIAEAGVIVASDVPSTFTASPQDRASAKKTLAIAKRTKGCAGYVKFAVANEAVTKADSQDFDTATENLSNEVYVHRSEAVASKLMSSLDSPTTADCLKAALQKRTELELKADRDLSSQVSDVTLTLDQSDIGEIATDQIAFEGLLTLELKDGSSQELNVGLVAVQVERVILTYSVSASPESTTIADVFAGAVTNTVDRTVAAL